MESRRLLRKAASNERAVGFAPEPLVPRGVTDALSPWSERCASTLSGILRIMAGYCHLLEG